MSHLPIPLAVVYAGLAGTLLALVVAAVTNRWSPRVFFLLALRLAIGWHFMFEGFHKIQSHATGPSDTNRPFSSEPYFKVAPGPLGEKMRKEFSDPAAEIAAKVKAPKEISRAVFEKLSPAEQASECPDAVAKAIDAMQANALEAMKARAEKELKETDDAEQQELNAATGTEQRALKGEWSPDELGEIRATADEERRKVRAAAAVRREQVRERLASYESAGPGLVIAVKTRPDGAALASQLDEVLKTLQSQAGDEFKKNSEAEQKSIDAVTAVEQKNLKAAWTDAEKAQIRAKAETARKEAKERGERNRQEAQKKAGTFTELVPKRIAAAKAEYARWVYGVDARNAQVKFVGDVAMTAQERIDHIAWVKAQAKEAQDRETDGLGNGNGTDVKRVAEFRSAAITAEADLARDANAFIAELKKDLNGGTAVEEKPEPSRGQRLDKFTMWFLVVVGGCVLFGLFTRVACVLAAGFLAMTYLAHPAFPWYPLPPNTEGNPVFINKNVIEALALLALACYPSGRWLGLDALVLRPFCKYKCPNTI